MVAIRPVPVAVAPRGGGSVAAVAPVAPAVPVAAPAGGGGVPVGAVDLTVDLGPGSAPYNYSDMTGSVLGEITALMEAHRVWERFPAAP